MMVFQPDPHGLPGYLEQCCHIRYQRITAPSCPHPVKRSFDLWHGHQYGRTQDIGLYFHIILLGSQCHRCTLASALVELFMQDPVGQFVGAGKAQPPRSRLILTQGCVDQDRTRFNREKDIHSLFLVVHSLQAVIKDGFTQDTPILAEILILQGDTIA